MSYYNGGVALGIVWSKLAQYRCNNCRISQVAVIRIEFPVVFLLPSSFFLLPRLRCGIGLPRVRAAHVLSTQGIGQVIVSPQRCHIIFSTVVPQLCFYEFKYEFTAAMRDVIAGRLVFYSATTLGPLLLLFQCHHGHNISWVLS